MTHVERDRVASLDAVRGLAALAVLWNHYYLAFGVEFVRPIFGTPLQIFADAYAAVILFFVLSGYVLSRNHVNQRQLPQLHLVAFWCKRAIRIIVPFTAVLLVSYILWHGVYGVYEESQPELSRWGKRLWSEDRVALPFSEYLKSVLMILPDTQFPLLPQAWTLRIEVGMSLLIPFLVLVAIRGSGWLAAFVIVAILVLDVYIYLAHFAMGILLAKHEVSLCRVLRGRRLLCALLLVLGIVLYGFRFPPTPLEIRLPPDILRLVVGLGATLILLLVLCSERAQRVLEHSLFQFIGRVSYSLYLVHLAVILLFSQAMIHYLTMIHGTEVFNFWLTMAATTVVALAVAHICHRFVERPAISQGRRLAKWIEQRAIDRASENAAT